MLVESKLNWNWNWPGIELQRALSSLRYRIATFALQRTFRFTPLGLAFCFFRFSNTRSSAPASLLVVTNLLSSPRPRPCFHLSLVQGATESLV